MAEKKAFLVHLDKQRCTKNMALYAERTPDGDEIPIEDCVIRQLYVRLAESDELGTRITVLISGQ